MNASAIELRHVTHALGNAGVAFSFSRETGSVTAVLGPSGAGKSTLLNLIAGFLAPDQGQVFVNGRDVTALPPAGRGVSMVFQDNNLFAHLDIRTNIALGLDPALRLGRAENAVIEAAMERVGLAGFGRRKPGTLSGGERQRVALARAFARRKPLLLLDEPFDGLGPGLAAEMLSLMLEIRAEVGATVLMVTHEPAEARAAADRVLFVDRGRIAADAPLAGFFERSDIPALRHYLGSGAPD
ncbi:thiamine transport system ATP-binding protein [Hoeflea marina]|uniref:Thiamine transport system ATP-binding protein n=1 Tax=Hoeflea marina TaxID=274592 RepID=A0A317PH27_9HYPH|nr:ATP-binding cassette domain-containing protein [Hoeflea marina]PWV98191.1 thiamine transport system ATP-binding protein [Hoeflea marina]